VKAFARGLLWASLAVLVGLGVVWVVAGDRIEPVLGNQEGLSRIALLFAWLVLITGTSYGAGEIKGRKAVKYLLVWFAVFVAVTGGYVLAREQGWLGSGPRAETLTTASTEVQARPRETADVLPGVQPAGRAVSLRKADDGHYWADASVQGGRVKFMVDTGASVVALTRTDAKRIGIDVDALDYDWDVRTAGGVVKGASVLLEDVTIGRVRIENVEAIVMPDVLEHSLLGMSFLERMNRWEVTQTNLILRQ
jgi:aspartyl protease family protein